MTDHCPRRAHRCRSRSAVDAFLASGWDDAVVEVDYGVLWHFISYNFDEYGDLVYAYRGDGATHLHRIPGGARRADASATTRSGASSSRRTSWTDSTTP